MVLALPETGFVDVSIPSAPPGSAEWMKFMTASKIAAVMAHSSYDSWFSLWHRMKGNILPDPEDDLMRRGHYLEPAVAMYMADQLPEWEFRTTGMWVAKDVPTFGATPDRIMVNRETGKLAVAECKSSNNDFEWGEELTEEIPLGYYDQVQWQMRCVRTHYPVDEAHVGVITNQLNFQRYVVPFDADYVPVLDARAHLFMNALANNEAPSIDPMDGHTQTYNAVKQLHPDIEARTVHLTDEHAVPFLELNAEAKELEFRLQAARTVIAAELGNAQTAKWRNHKLFGRQVRKGGTPYMVVARNLPEPTITEEETNV